jgi:hypothetical protein
MKLAIMQPYFFPYIGYWQLLNAADRFVIYDDVNFIKQGWINRNRILINGAPRYITVPLDGASPNKRICDIAVQGAQRWRSKTIKSIECAYGKSAFYSAVFPEIERQIRHESVNLAEFLAAHLTSMAEFLGIETEIIPSSRVYSNSDLSSQERIIDICRREGASAYINLPGGRELYDAESFGAANVNLEFLSSRISPYRQRTANFVPNLSVIDALMETGTDGVAERLCEFDLAVAGAILKESNTVN